MTVVQGMPMLVDAPEGNFPEKPLRGHSSRFRGVFDDNRCSFFAFLSSMFTASITFVSK